jgi:hypothetical protein
MQHVPNLGSPSLPDPQLPLLCQVERTLGASVSQDSEVTSLCPSLQVCRATLHTNPAGLLVSAPCLYSGPHMPHRVRPLHIPLCGVWIGVKISKTGHLDAQLSLKDSASEPRDPYLQPQTHTELT